MDIRRYAALAALATLAGCSSPTPAQPQPGSPAASEATAAKPSGGRQYLLERVDDAAVVQLYADGFASLPLKQKTLIYHLYEAALAGRDIYIDQRHRDALEMRGVFEQIVA